MKDHEIAKLVNDLRDTAVQFHDSQQLRDRISRLVNDALAQQPAATPDFESYMTAEYGKQFARGSFPAGAMRKCWNAARTAPGTPDVSTDPI
ncbi:hypothetical protein WJ97_13020 [Burkholderia ubonensis]|uniref:hypothetical protein n=1 Tax=Burkholderia ubonensis TaxID=101571 RepID=UPI00075C48C1|nr:hypothetical protein [Burkholderia ubonensis]KVP96796.1 hypothetical protein WJ97_13020 [Burkholderia ubonensis]